MGPDTTSRWRKGGRSLPLLAIVPSFLVFLTAAQAQDQHGIVTEPTIDDIIEAHRSDERIVGGDIATKGQWQSMVAVFVKDGQRSRNFCGGTIIDKKWVLTAAHCVAAMQRMKDKKAAVEFFVKEKTQNLQDGTGRAIPVASYITHEAYNPKLTLNDVGLLRLSAESAATPQKLIGRDMVADLVKKDAPSTVVGFGLVEEGGAMSAQLRQVVLPIVEQADCRKAYDDQSITEVNFCAGLKGGGKDSCQGDSGGPLFLPDPNSGEQLQSGVVSWGRGCARPNAYGVYASVGSFQDWIKSKVPGVKFSSRSTASKPVDAVMSGLTEGAAQASKPSQLAQVTMDITQGSQVAVNSFIDVRITSSVDGVVVVFAENPDGTSKQIYPSKIFPSGGKDPNVARIEAGKTLQIPSAMQKEQGYRFIIRPPLGTSALRAIVAPAKPRIIEAISEHSDGAELADLKAVIARIIEAELQERGAEPMRIVPTDRATTSITYEIVAAP